MNIKMENIETITVKLLDHMGSDADIDRAARLSYDNMEKERSEEEIDRLVRYLYWNRHTSPFEMVTFKFLVKMPIFVARQMVRHRTASLNEVSRRYTSENISFFDFELRKADTSITKQGSGTVIEENDSRYTDVHKHIEEGYKLYTDLIESGVARETARIVQPMDTMTTWVWKIDLHNLLHFLNLRWDTHAQKEIQIVAEQILNLITPIVPISVQAFKDWKKFNDAVRKKGYGYFKSGEIDEFIENLEKIKNK